MQKLIKRRHGRVCGVYAAGYVLAYLLISAVLTQKARKL